MPEPDGWYALLALDPQVVAEVHTPSRIVFRLSLSGYVPLAGNLRDLCPEAPRALSSCDPADGKSGARAIQASVAPMGRFSLSYAF